MFPQRTLLLLKLWLVAATVQAAPRHGVRGLLSTTRQQDATRALKKKDDEHYEEDEYEYEGASPLASPVEAPYEEPVLPPVTEPIQEPVEDPEEEEIAGESPPENEDDENSEPQDEAVPDEVLQEPAEESVEVPAEPPADEVLPVEAPVPEEVPVEVPVEEPIAPPVEPPVEEPVAPPVEPPVGELVAPPVEPPVEEPITPPIEPPEEEPIAPPVEPPVEVPVEPPVELPVSTQNEEVEQTEVAQLSLRAACDHAKEGKTYNTDNHYVISYIFELNTRSDAVLVSRSVQELIRQFVLQKFMIDSGTCDEHLNNRKLSETLSGLYGVGTASNPTVLSKECEGDSSSDCYRIMASVVLFFGGAPPVDYETVKEASLELIYESRIVVDTEDGYINFRPEDELKMQEQEEKGSVSGVNGGQETTNSSNSFDILGSTGMMLGLLGFILLTLVVSSVAFFLLCCKRSDNLQYQKKNFDDDSLMERTQAISPQQSLEDNPYIAEGIRVPPSYVGRQLPFDEEAVFSNFEGDKDAIKDLYQLQFLDDQELATNTSPKKKLVILGADQHPEDHDELFRAYKHALDKNNRENEPSRKNYSISDTVAF